MLDNFGIGNSILSYLRRHPIDKIKIDRSFVAGLPQDKVSAALIQAVIRLARVLRLEIAAEGVDTEAQKNRLAMNGCRSIQGFLTGGSASRAGIDGRPFACQDLGHVRADAAEHHGCAP